jgi:hypothetical protein
MDLKAVADAIADRFAGITPPPGYTKIQKASGQRQKGIGKLPVVMVRWDTTRDLTYGFGEREGFMDFTATLFVSKASDVAKTDAAIQAWHDALADALLGELQLDQWGAPNGVRGAYVRSLTPEYEALEEEWATIDVTIEVEFHHAIGALLSA